MFNTGSWPTITISVVESVHSGLESAGSSADSNADPAKVGVWVRAFTMSTPVLITTPHFPVMVLQ